ncbi:hypothetical protein TSUD_363860 [Trifolium subterraneum]|uniref:Uncharacterized protein n=1 Tax=Trifolium subterraneum TaxID=3900 RepID=A0A2Z6P8L7_TRISU|nr:hypothetical protein TSUD_363860 [Trifolium subterraneum]
MASGLKTSPHLTQNKCTTVPLVEQVLDPLKPRIENVWPSLTGNDIDLWTYEWKVHGTCSTMTAYDYFKLALDLYAKSDIKGLLQKSKSYITPGTKPILKKDIEDAIKLGTGSAPQLNCDKNSGNLLEVRLCFHTSTNPKDFEILPYYHIMQTVLNNTIISSTCPSQRLQPSIDILDGIKGFQTSLTHSQSSVSSLVSKSYAFLTVHWSSLDNPLPPVLTIAGSIGAKDNSITNIHQLHLPLKKSSPPIPLKLLHALFFNNHIRNATLLNYLAIESST